MLSLSLLFCNTSKNSTVCGKLKPFALVKGLQFSLIDNFILACFSCDKIPIFPQVHNPSITGARVLHIQWILWVDSLKSIIPTIIFVVFAVITIGLSVIVTRPNVTRGKFTKKDVANKKVNLLFFGNFYKMY